MTVPDDLVEGWRAAAGSDGRAERLRADLAARYGEAHRRYHSFDHLVHVVRRAHTLIAAEPAWDGPVAANSSAPHAPAIVLAAWFHDAVYDPTSATNEADSAALAAAGLAGLVAHDVIDDVMRLVLATRDHCPAALDEAILLDADLAVLGAPAPAYDRYVAGVREEYVHVSDAAWRTGRVAVLDHFLARPVFATALARLDEAQASANLSRERIGLVRRD